jgi:hypothetical protein
MAEARIINEER